MTHTHRPALRHQPVSFMNIDDAFARVRGPSDRVRLNADGTVALTLPTLTIRDTGLAILSIEGALMQEADAFSEVYGGCVEDAKVIELLRQARENAAVKNVILKLSSPGGSVMGESELVTAVAALDRVKPVVAMVNDLATSKAYKLACACREIVATPSGIVGSIATALHIVDDSGIIEKLGGLVATLVSGKRKLTGRMTQDKLDSAQQMVNALGESFAQYVAVRRNLPAETVMGWEGASFTAEQGVRMGLVDRLMQPEDLIAEMDRLAMGEKPAVSEGRGKPAHSSGSGGLVAGMGGVSGLGERTAQSVEGVTQNTPSPGDPTMSIKSSTIKPGAVNPSANASAASAGTGEDDASKTKADESTETNTNEAGTETEADKKKDETTAQQSVSGGGGVSDRIAALQAAFPTDDALVLEALKNNWDVATAKAHAYDRLKSAAESGGQGTGKGRPTVAAGAAAPLVSQPSAPMIVAAGEQAVANAIAGIKADKAGYSAAVDVAMKTGQLDRGKAVAIVNRLRPDLRKSYAG